MGHYDSCYDADEKDKNLQESAKIDSNINKAIKSLSIEEKKFLLLIIKNIDVIKSFKSFLQDLK
jgi:hypothetical protein